MSTTEIKTGVRLRAEPSKATAASHAATESKLNSQGLAMTAGEEGEWVVGSGEL